MVHELLSPGVQGSDILYIATREESRGIKERGKEKERERVSWCMNKIRIITSYVDKQ